VPFDLALFDLVNPYVLLGDSFGQWHAALSVIFVDEHTIAIDDAGIVIRGVARFGGSVTPWIDPSTMSFGIHGESTEGHPANDPGRRDPWIDIRDAHIDFQLTAPAIASQKVSKAVAAIGGAAPFASSAAVLNAYDANPADAPPSDYASTEFVLDMLLTTVLLRPPFLRPAKLQPNGLMVEDTTTANVTFTLPRIKFRLAQGSSLNDPLTVTILSAGASSLDATEDIGVAQLVTMDPPYAFIGPSKVVGFGFRSATLDLSDGSTPPDVLSQFGFDENWTGLYLSEIRLFIAPHGADDFAVDAGARNLLIGIGASAGITGDFDLEVINQGSGHLSVGARFYNGNQSFAITSTSDTTARVALPLQSRMIVDIDGGLTPYDATVAIDGGAPAVGRVFDIDLSTQPRRVIVIDVTDSKPTPNQATLTVTANRLRQGAPAIPGTSTPGAPPAAVLETTSMTQGGSPVGAPRFVLVNETASSVTVALEGAPPPNAHWIVGGTDRGNSTSVLVDLPPGTNVTLQADATDAIPQGEFTAYYRFDHPENASDNDVRAYTQITDSSGSVRSTNTVPAADEGLTAPWPGGMDAGTAITPLLASLPPGASITVNGYASFETGGPQKLAYNTALARRRAIGLEAIVTAHQGAKNFNITSAADMSHWNPADQGDPVRNLFWKAVATWPAQTMPGTSTQGHVSRGTAGGGGGTPAVLPDDPTAATPPPKPDWFKEMGAKVRIVRNQFVACEVFGKFDIQTATERQLQQGGVSNADMPALRRLGNNPADGIIDVRVIVQIDDATDTDTVTGYFGADPADRDGLLMTGWLPDEPMQPRHLGRNYLGMVVIFTPLLSAAASAVAGDGALAEIAVTSAVLALPFTLGSLPQITVERVIWYGGEIHVQVRPEGAQVAILLDLEAAVSMDIAIGSFTLIQIPRDSPLQVRYKAIGLLIGNPPGQPVFQFRPVFDASKGYTIDVSRPGAIQVASPLDQILKILGARIARNNPLLFEIDLGFAIDLGVVSIERARVRLHMDPPGPPELTAFAASINIPEAVKGRGYLEMSSKVVDGHNVSEIKGQLDLTLIPVQVRIAAGVGIAHIDPDQTGVIVTLDVEFPVAIPLANSGLGIYGFLGLFAMSYARDESKGVPAAGMAPALAWLRATGGDPTRIDFWTPRLNTWALGLGAILGTMGSSIVFNLKGVFLLELPGPRLLLMMKANLLIPMPDREGNAEGMFLAVIDLDFGRGTLTIGLAIDFNIDPLLRLTIPIEAFFNFIDTSDWHLFIGQYINQVQAKVLQIFDASGYVMLSGKGLSGIGNLPAVTGFSLATGLHVSFTWGGGPLFAQLAAGFDAIIGFSPFRMAGTLTVRGTLHLFILDISAWADLNVDIGERVNPNGTRDKIAQISGDICGKVEFLFFSIEGCVSFSLGDSAGAVPPPPPLIKSMKLISRSPALVLGTGVDKPIDSGLADAVEADDTAPDGLPQIPIDAIPTLLMNQPPLQDPALKFLGQNIGSTPEAPGDGWVQRGDVWFKYTVKNVELLGPLTAGATPATWWKPKSGSTAIEAQLALLSWVPEATPKAVGSSKFLDESVKEHWGTVCNPAAAAAPVFWTFLGELLGASVIGWNLAGEAWPDPPGAVRSTPPDLKLRVTERWRSGNLSVDKLRGILPALVEGLPVACPKDDPLIPHRLVAVPSQNLSGRVSTTLPFDNPIASIRGLHEREALPQERLSVVDVIQRFTAGQPVSRSVIATATLPGAAATNPPGAAAGCFAKALASPMFDDGRIIAFGPQAFEEEVKMAWPKLGFHPGPLDDAVVVHTGEFEYARFFLYIPNRFLVPQVVVVAASDAKDNFGDQHIVAAPDRMPPAAFPPHWIDPAGQWRNEVILLSELVALNQEYSGVFIQVKGGNAMDRVQIGALQSSRDIRTKITLKPFYIAAIEVLRKSEKTRSDYDESEQKKKQGVLTDVLSLNSADNALLAANQTYQVRVTYDAERQKRPPGGGAPTDPATVHNQKQSFWFHTDANPPARLDPWILATAPSDGDQHVFASEPVKIVFATNNLNLMYDAYGKKLQARLKPSSFRPITPPPGIQHPFPIDATTLQPVKVGVLSPWEQSVQNLVISSLPCIPVEGDRVRHTVITIPIPLDLYTDYVLDIEMLDKAAADGSPGTRIYRESFSTGGFQTLDEFAKSFMTARVGHRGVHSDDAGKLQAIGTKFASQAPQGSDFDAEWQKANMDALAVPKSPRSTVFWEPGVPDPQPVAILIDASEPMFRSRPIPKEVADGGLAAAKRFEMVSEPWLEAAEQAGGDPLVDVVVPVPGGQRALITLKPGSRGKHVKVALHRFAFPQAHLDGVSAVDQFATILDLELEHAPWEEVD
jgi:large repetitive protein